MAPRGSNTPSGRSGGYTTEHGKGIMIEYKNTVEAMESPDYRTRFWGEYWQLKIRYGKLHRMLVQHAAGTLPFTPTCPIELLAEQKKHMGEYLRCLEIRAEIEKVDISEKKPGDIAPTNEAWGTKDDCATKSGCDDKDVKLTWSTRKHGPAPAPAPQLLARESDLGTEGIDRQSDFIQST